MSTKRPPNREYSQFREYFEALSAEEANIPRNHFYIHAFNDGTLPKIADVRKTVEEMYLLAKDF